MSNAAFVGEGDGKLVHARCTTAARIKVQVSSALSLVSVAW